MRTSTFLYAFGFVVLLFVVARVLRHRAASGSEHVQLRVSPGGEEEEGPTVRFRIGAIHRGVQPAPQAPFFAPGGDWLFFEATLEEDPTARFTVGVTQGRASGTTGTAWGKAVLAVQSAEAGSALVRSVAAAFGAELASPRQGGPLEPLTLSTAVLGERLARAPGGGFSGRGSWTAAKWFLQLEGREAEVYFNYDLEAEQGELTEKDADYAQPLVEVLAMALRDGRPPERTPANDPTLSAEGPRFERVRQVGSARASVLGTAPDGEAFYVVDRGSSGGTVLRAVSPSEEQPRELLHAEGYLDAVQCLPDGSACLVREVVPRVAGQVSSDDPARLWWVDLRSLEREPLQVAELSPRPEFAQAALSPDGRFLALRAWTAFDPGKPRVLRAFVVHRAGGKAVEVRGGKESYDVVGWEGTGASVRARLVSGFSWDPPASRAHALFDPASGALTATDAAAGDRHISPDGRWRWDFEEGALRVSETKGGTPRTLRLHPEDARAAEESGGEAFSWVSPRYLALDGPSYVLVNTETMRASLPLPRDARAPLAFSRSGQSALLGDEDGLFLARVQLPAP